MMTAIVSPSARPRPRITAPTIPDCEAFSTTLLIVSHRVAPSPSDASRNAAGTVRMTSRETEVMNGVIMIASTNSRRQEVGDYGRSLEEWNRSKMV